MCAVLDAFGDDAEIETVRELDDRFAYGDGIGVVFVGRFAYQFQRVADIEGLPDRIPTVKLKSRYRRLLDQHGPILGNDDRIYRSQAEAAKQTLKKCSALHLCIPF